MQTTTINRASSTEALGTPAPSEQDKKIKVNKPKYTKFSQQELPGCKPLMTPAYVTAVFMLVGAVFIPIGVITLYASNKVVEEVHQYESVCLDQSATQQNRTAITKDQRISFIQDPTVQKNCTVSFTIMRAMSQPIYVYYELSNFYQNHRRYVKSRSDAQLRGMQVLDKDLTSCKPEDIANGEQIVPCGLIAWSLFNDTYAFSIGNDTVSVNRKGIAWVSDINAKFGAGVVPSNFLNNNPNATNIGGGVLPEGVPLNQNEDLLVWMRVAAFPTFRKLWGKIEQDIPAYTNMTISIENVYNTFSFDGTKKLVLSTSTWIGGKNDFLGAAYLAVGTLCVLLAIAFFITYYRNPRPLGDASYFTWNKETTRSHQPLGQFLINSSTHTSILF